MSYTVHPHKRAHEATDYPVFSNALNPYPYNYKDLGNVSTISKTPGHVLQYKTIKSDIITSKWSSMDGS